MSRQPPPVVLLPLLELRSLKLHRFPDREKDLDNQHQLDLANFDHLLPLLPLLLPAVLVLELLELLPVLPAVLPVLFAVVLQELPLPAAMLQLVLMMLLLLGLHSSVCLLPWPAVAALEFGVGPVMPVQERKLPAAMLQMVLMMLLQMHLPTAILAML